MAKEFSRNERIADYLKRELAVLLQRQVRDPRVGMVSITGLALSGDSSFASVFFTVLGKEQRAQAEETQCALNQAAGFLRSRLASDSRMRKVPQLRFVFDNSVGRGAYLEDLIERAVTADSHNRTVG